MPFQRLLCHRIPPRSFSGAIIYISKRKGSGMEADASLSGASQQCPLSLLPAVTRPFHRSCTEQGNAVSVQRSGSRYLLSGIAGESPWGSQENFFGIRSGRSRRPCPDSLPGVFILTAKVASLFVRTFSHGCFACPHRRTHHVRRPIRFCHLPRRWSLPVFPSPRRWTSCPWRGWPAPPAKPAAAFTCGIINAKSGVALKTALSAPNQRIIKRIPPSILSMTRIRCCAAPKSSPPTMSTASAS